MRLATTLATFALFSALAATSAAAAPQNKKLLQISPKITAAKTLYFENQTGNSAVGNKALTELQKWARFTLVDDPRSADIAIILSAVRYSSDMTLFGKQIGGDTAATPPEFAYITVVDPATKESLWNDSCHWGGVLTGVNSAGARLIKRFKQQISSASSQNHHS